MAAVVEAFRADTDFSESAFFASSAGSVEVAAAERNSSLSDELVA